METILIAINAKFSHTSLSVRYLKDALTRAGGKVDVVEYTINQPIREILNDLWARGAQRLLFSCYIWNIDYVAQIAQDYRLLCPEAEIILGGPEVSFEAESRLPQLPWADAIVCGEGEVQLPKLLGEERLSGVYYGEGFVDMDTLPFPYEDLSVLTNRVLYYESTRGCPYGCAYCLSSADRTVRYRSIQRVQEDLQRFLDAKVMKVKFVDRTFNVNEAHATAIWEYLIDHDNGVTSFQMELGGDLTTPAQLALLARARRGLFQFEIGVQSTCEATLVQVARATDMEKLCANVAAVKAMGPRGHQATARAKKPEEVEKEARARVVSKGGDPGNPRPSDGSWRTTRATPAMCWDSPLMANKDSPAQYSCEVQNQGRCCT